MATITASLGRSLQNCSLNHTTTRRRSGAGAGAGASRSSSSDSPNQPPQSHHLPSNASSSDDISTLVDLNSHLSLPYHWEQCLDLKTGETYYINWKNGMKAKEDPRTRAARDCYYSEEEEEEDESNGYNSEGSSTESSPCSSTSTRESFISTKKLLAPASGSGSHELYDDDDDDDQESRQESILVVAGCKRCLMYYMVPKHVEDCPKCSGQLLHFPAHRKPS